MCNARFLVPLSFLLVASFAQAQPRAAAFFVPDYTFEGSSLAGSHPLGAATWQASDGVITGHAGQGDGWLLSEQGFQDVAVGLRFRCEGPCDAGVLLRAASTADGMNGVLVSLKGERVGMERVAISREGHIRSREMLVMPQGLLPAPELRLRPDEWNAVDLFIRENGLSAHLNEEWNFVVGPEHMGAMPVQALAAPSEGAGGTVPVDTSRFAFGPVALYVGAGRVQFDDISIKDLLRVQRQPERHSSRFRVQRIEDFEYAWGADVADINRDGLSDITVGPFYYLGPDFLTRYEFFPARSFNPGREYPTQMLSFANDWTGDGWVDIVVSEQRPLVLFVNPAGESRRWQRIVAVPDVCSEVSLRADVDSDGEPELIYADDQGRVAYAEPDPANPTGQWLLRKVSAAVGPVFGCSIHGLGAGDINGDGRTDILQTRGWWEQPAANPAGAPWTYHSAVFGRSAEALYDGGGLLSVYDFNGDGLNDVVGSLDAHFLGLAWWEQHRDASGAITFERHHIMDTFADDNAGDVAFSQPHAGAVLVDLDRDGVMDFVAGKRHWAHLDGGDPDPDGDAVLYGYRTVRDTAAPSGVRFEPELIHNRSGAGSEIKTADIDGDGAMDLVTAGSRGAFIFWGIALR